MDFYFHEPQVKKVKQKKGLKHFTLCKKRRILKFHKNELFHDIRMQLHVENIMQIITPCLLSALKCQVYPKYVRSSSDN